MDRAKVWAGKVSEYLIYFILVALPLERVPALHPYIGSFEVTVRLTQIAGVLLILTSLPKLWEVRHQLLRTPWRWAVLFMFLAVLSTGLAVNLGRAMMVTAFIGFDIALAWAISNEVLLKRIQRYQVIVIISGVAASLFGIFQFFGDLRGLPTSITGLLPRYTKDVFSFPRVQAASYEPLFFANYLLLPLSLAAVKVLEGRKRYLLAVIVMMIAFWLTLSRGAYFGLAGGLLFLGIWAIRHKLLKRFGLTLAAAVAGIMIAVGCVAISQDIKVTGPATPSTTVAFTTPEAKDEFIAENKLEVAQLQPSTENTYIIPVERNQIIATPGTIVQPAKVDDSVKIFASQSTSLTAGDSFYNRSATWNTAWAAFVDHPLFGTGPGTFGIIANGENPAYYTNKDAVVNNEPLELLAEHGLLGTLALFGFVASIARLVWVQAKKGANELAHFQIALCAALIGIAIQYQTFSTLYITHIWVTIGLLMSTLRLQDESANTSS